MTSEELVALSEAINTRLFNLVTELLVPPLPAVDGERVPKVVDRLIVDSDHRAWAAMLKSDRHIEIQNGDPVKQVHTIMIYPKGMRTLPNSTVRSRKWQFEYGIDNFYQDYPGKTNDNPGFRQNKEIVLVADTLFITVPFGVDGVERIVGWRENRALTRIGDVMIRQSMSILALSIHPASIPNA